MTSTVSSFKFCDDKTRDIVFGYIREIEQLMMSYSIIPTNIIHICLSYYLILEQFLECGNKHIIISNENKTIKNIHSQWDTAYGAFEIDCNDKMNKNKIFQWTFFIHNHAQSCSSIGIDETSRKYINTYPDSRKQSVHYNFNSDRTKWICGTRKRGSAKYGFQADDIVIMQLDIDEQALKYEIIKKGENIQKEMCIINDIQVKDVTYCICIYLWVEGSLTLTDFCVIQKS
eukprot:255598_1